MIETIPPIPCLLLRLQGFINMVQALRAKSQAFGVAATKVSTALETWMVIESSSGAASEEFVRAMGEVLKPMQECWKVLVGYLQVTIPRGSPKGSPSWLLSG